MATKKPAASAAENLIIVNNKPCPVVLPCGRRFGPGQNDCPSDVWAKSLKNPAVKQWVAMGIVQSLGAGKAKSLHAGIEGLTEDEADSKIFRSRDIEEIRTWADSTPSARVQKLCETRIRELIAAVGESDDDSVS